mmetsp:Transcript_6384/g.21959  ORF Transcript_6384/g.21959 Transcript_6384/m.21959 type:complete len:290 (-) Transcript_6384:499-1368(-)
MGRHEHPGKGCRGAVGREGILVLAQLPILPAHLCHDRRVDPLQVHRPGAEHLPAHQPLRPFQRAALRSPSQNTLLHNSEQTFSSTHVYRHLERSFLPGPLQSSRDVLERQGRLDHGRQVEVPLDSRQQLQRQIDGAAPAADDFELVDHDGSSVQSRRPGTGRLQDEGAERVEERAGLLESERTPGGLYGAVARASRGPQSLLALLLGGVHQPEGEACASGGGGFGSSPEQVQLLRVPAAREDLEGLCIRGRPLHQVRHHCRRDQQSEFPVSQYSNTPVRTRHELLLDDP